MSKITAQELREHLDYCPETGLFRKRKSERRWKAGMVIGHSTQSGYVDITIKRRQYQAHRLAWLYVYGEWPSGEIDHINEDRSDNRISNLRIATRSQNVIRSNPRSKSGFKGVYQDGSRWSAQIRVDRKCIYLGSYGSPEEAADVVSRAHRFAWGEFSKGAS